MLLVAATPLQPHQAFINWLLFFTCLFIAPSQPRSVAIPLALPYPPCHVPRSCLHLVPVPLHCYFSSPVPTCSTFVFTPPLLPLPFFYSFNPVSSHPVSCSSTHFPILLFIGLFIFYFPSVFQLSHTLITPHSHPPTSTIPLFINL